jgi:integrase
MGRTINKLTAVGISKLAKRGRYGDGGGLWLNVSHSGSKAWVFRWSPKGGKPREMGLGPYPEVTLADARKMAVSYRQHNAAGRDPKTERDRGTGVSFYEAAERYLEAMSSKWTNEKTRWQWQTTLLKNCSALHKRPVAQVDTADILGVLNKIWTKTPETASRVRMRLEAVLDYAKAQGCRDGENPARWKGHLENILPKRDRRLVKHHPALRYQDLPDFMVELNERDALAARALELLILTASRTGEVLKAQWSEIDLEAALWIIPAERMKAKNEHRIPLSKAALSILKPLQEMRVSDFMFPGQKRGKPLSNMSMEMILRRMNRTDITVHGFRSSFRDWCGDETEYPREIAEAALAHRLGDSVELAYRRGDALLKRRALMEDWSGFCLGKVRTASFENV